MGFKDEMEQFDEQFEEDKLKAPGGRLPDGTYPEAQLTEMRVEHDQAQDAYSLVLKFESDMDTAGGDPVRGSIRKWYNLDHEVGRSICAQDMKRFGYEGKLSEIEEVCESEEYLGLICEIAVKTKPGDERDFTNVYINRVLGKESLPEPTPAAAGSPDDDIPF